MKRLSRKEEKKLFNLGYLDLLEGNPCPGKWQLPQMISKSKTCPDYIALYSQPGDYSHTPNAAVCFAQYDNVIDGLNGIFNAIKYERMACLEKFRRRFKDVTFIIIPDYSQYGGGPNWVNAGNLGKGRIVGLWFQKVMHKIVIPLITFPDLEWLDEVLIGLMKCDIVAFHTKCYVRNLAERKILIKAVIKTVDTLPLLKTIVVYDVCGKDDAVDSIFLYAHEKNIRVVVPDNMLKCRNCNRSKKRMIDQ